MLSPMLSPGHRSQWLPIGRLLLLLVLVLAAVSSQSTISSAEVALGSNNEPRGQATPLFTVSGLNARNHHILPDEPDWAKSLELAR